MTMDVAQCGEVLVATPHLEVLDQDSAPAFKRELAAHLAPGRRLVLDLGELQFIDSSGLGVILSALRQASGAGGDLKLARVTSPVRTLFELVRMHRVFEIYATVDEAIRSF